jgi:hypothetical protein
MTKVNMKKVGGIPTYVKYADHKAGDVLVNEGKFLGTFEGNYGENHKFEADGKEIVLNSSGQLNYLIKTYLEIGALATVIYQGKEKLTKGPMKGKEAHRFELLVSEEAASTAPKAASKSLLDELE